MANRRFIDFPIAASVGNNDIVLIWQDGLNKQTTKATLLQGSPQSLAGLTDVDISALNNGQILQYNSTTSKWENVDRTDINLSELGDVTIVAPANGQVLVYNSSTSKWENSSAGYVPYTGAVTTVNLGAQTIQAGSFVKAGGTSAQFLKANGSVDSTAYGTGTVTSVALTMPTAFSVANSPITTAGTLAVTGAGTVGQYIRGDGSLADFPATTGGGSSVSYYLNGSVSQGTIGGVAYKELNKTPIFGAGTDITINADGYIASFITDAGDPNKLLIPAGNWNFETYFSASSNGGSPSFYIELYKYNGTTFTLIASSSSAPELIAFGTNLNPYFSALAVPETVLALTDRLALRYYVTHSGRTITLHTENNHLCQVITTFTSGLTALNGLTSQVQYLTVGTSGTDFAISSVTDTHTFNLPTASATNRGALSSADWTTFNNKQNALTNPVTGTGTTNYLPKFTGSSTIGNSLIFDNGTNVGINTNSPSAWNGNQGLIVSQYSASGNSIYSLQSNTTVVDTGAVYEGFSNAVTVGSKALGSIAFLRENTSTIALNSYTGFYTNNAGVVSEKIRITSDGSLGIGNILPNKKLHISASGEGLLRLERTGASARQWDINIKPNFVIGDNTAGQDRFFIDTLGNVGIGATPDASFKLDVNGTGRFNANGSIFGTNSAGGTGLNIQAGNGASTLALIGRNNSGIDDNFVAFRKFDGTTLQAAFYVRSNIFSIRDATNTDVLTIQAGASTFSGSVTAGGGNSPTLGFQLTTTTGSSTPRITNDAINATVIRTGASGSPVVINNFANSSELVRFTDLGNVGINQSNPTGRLEVVPANAGGNEGIFVNQLGSHQSTIRFKSAHSSSSDYRVGASITVGSAFEIYSIAAATSRLVITSAGIVDISGPLVVRGTLPADQTDAAVIDHNGNTMRIFSYGAAGVTGDFQFRTAAGGAGSNLVSTINGTTGVYVAVSDINKKKDFEQSTIGLDAILGLKPTLYRMKNDNSNSEKQLGFIAQEVKDYIKQAYVEKDDFIGLNYNSIIPVLVKAIQELNEKIK